MFPASVYYGCGEVAVILVYLFKLYCVYD